MELVTSESVANYAKSDATEYRLNTLCVPEDEDLLCQRWLRDSQPKRYIFERMYGELFDKAPPSRILDVGGGLTGLTRAMANRHDYQLVDLLAHGEEESAADMATQVGVDFIKRLDWANLSRGSYDLVIANDLFPNVDQRLEMFLGCFLPCSHRIRMSLTYYDTPRFYMTRRVDADEILCVLAWSSEHLTVPLKKYSSRIMHEDFEIFSRPGKSVFANGRQVCLIDFKGDLKAGGVQ